MRESAAQERGRLRRATTAQRRGRGVVVVAFAALLLVACQGRTTGASHFSPSNNTIRLNGVGSCDTQCTAYVRYRRVGTSTWTNSSSFTVGSKVADAPFSRTVTVSPGLRYEYQVCGKENSQNQFFCAGPDGTGGTTEQFTAGPLQPHTGTAQDVYDVRATLTGDLQSTQAGQVSWWFEHGPTASYGEFRAATTVSLPANTVVQVSAPIGTSPGSTYHYRLCAIGRADAAPGEAGTVCGTDRTLTTNTGTTVTCGQRITATTRLGNDLTGCAGDGLVIGAPNITLDLNGHRIVGNNVGLGDLTCPGPGQGPTFGINAGEGHDRLIIKNGLVGGDVSQAFHEGIWLGGADDSVIENVSVVGHICTGLTIIDSDRTVVADSTVADTNRSCCARNIAVESSQGVIIRNNVVSDGPHSAIQFAASDGGRIEGNRVFGTEPSFDFGIELLFGSDGNQVVANRVEGARRDGIVLAVSSNDNVVDRNIVSNMTLADPDPDGEAAPAQYAGIEVIDGSSRNRITNNQVLDTVPRGIAVGLAEPSEPLGSTVGNTVSGNTVLRSGRDGIIIGTLATNTVVSGNTASSNADDGIDVDVSSTTISGNTTRNNGDLGIEAVAGVTDGGGNRASGNRNATRQCLNVACAT